MTYKAGTFQHAGQLCYVKKKAIYWLLNEAQSLRMKLPCLSWEEKLLLSWYAMPAICSSIAWFMPVSKQLVLQEIGLQVNISCVIAMFTVMLCNATPTLQYIQ